MEICEECGYEHSYLRCPACMLGSDTEGEEEEEEEEEEEVETGIITVSEDEEGPELGTAIAEEPGTAVAEEPGTAVIVIEEGPGTVVAEEPGAAVSRRWRRWQRGSLAPVAVTNPEA